MVESKVPSLPHRVVGGGGKGRVRLRGAVVRSHHSLGQEKVAKQTSNKKVLAKQLLE